MIRGSLNDGYLEDQIKGTEYFDFPIVLLSNVVQSDESNQDSYYECPIFISQERERTNDQDNFLMAIRVPSIAQTDYWFLKGVALICNY